MLHNGYYDAAPDTSRPGGFVAIDLQCHLAVRKSADDFKAGVPDFDEYLSSGGVMTN